MANYDTPIVCPRPVRMCSFPLALYTNHHSHTPPAIPPSPRHRPSRTPSLNYNHHRRQSSGTLSLSPVPGHPHAAHRRRASLSRRTATATPAPLSQGTGVKTTLSPSPQLVQLPHVESEFRPSSQQEPDPINLELMSIFSAAHSRSPAPSLSNALSLALSPSRALAPSPRLLAPSTIRPSSSLGLGPPPPRTPIPAPATLAALTLLSPISRAHTRNPLPRHDDLEILAERLVNQGFFIDPAPAPHSDENVPALALDGEPELPQHARGRSLSIVEVENLAGRLEALARELRASQTLHTPSTDGGHADQSQHEGERSADAAEQAAKTAESLAEEARAQVQAIKDEGHTQAVDESARVHREGEAVEATSDGQSISVASATQ